MPKENETDSIRKEFDKFIGGVQANYQLYLDKLDDRTFEKKNIKIEGFWQFFQTQLQQAKKEGMIEVLENCLFVYKHLPQTDGALQKTIEDKVDILKSLAQKEE